MQERSVDIERAGAPAHPALASDSGAIRHGLMLELNEQLVLDFVHTHATTTRPEIAASLGLSAAT
jgi:hypothetical protein